jgi:hypothetical protein
MNKLMVVVDLDAIFYNINLVKIRKKSRGRVNCNLKPRKSIPNTKDAKFLATLDFRPTYNNNKVVRSPNQPMAASPPQNRN